MKGDEVDGQVVRLRPGIYVWKSLALERRKLVLEVSTS